MQRDFPQRIAVVVGYVCVALAFSWPLPLHLSDALTGPPGGDTGVYVWNQWMFQHQVLDRHSNPFSTDRILSMTNRVDLSQHNYTVFMNVLAMPFVRLLGVVRTFNIVYLLVTVITALCTYALARKATSATRVEAWLAGLAFAWSPALVARGTGHFSLVAAAPLAAFLLCFLRAVQTQRLRDAALAGLCVAWAGFCDPYYAIYCALIAGGYLLSRVVHVTFSREPGSPALRWILNALIVLVGSLVTALAMGSSGQFQLLGVSISMRSLYTPVLALTLLVLMRIAVAARPRMHLSRPLNIAATAKAMAVGILACAAPLSPVLLGLVERVLDGRFVSPPILWRSSPRGVDLLGLFEFNPNHALVRAVDDRLAADAAAFPEYTAALGLAALGTIAFAVWRAGYRPRAAWIWLAAGFAALSLGPFVYVAGTNTYVPGPWAFLRFVPLLDAARTPTRFSVVAALGVAVLFAGALVALRERFPQHRRAMLTIAALLLVFELAPLPRPLYAASHPSFLETIKRDPRPVRVVQLPFGVRDGTFNVGNFSARYLFYQTVHQKRLMGGYLSRISERRLRDVRAQPTLDALMTMSEGKPLGAPQGEWIRARGPGFLSRANVGYVIVDEARTPPYLRQFVIDAWNLREVSHEAGMTLFVPRSSAASAVQHDSR